MTSEKGARIELTVPAEQRMMMCVRLTTSGVLARAGLRMDAMDDMRMAVEEACNCLMRFAGSEMLHIEYEVLERGIEINICAKGVVGERAEPSEDELYTIRCILLSMAGEVELHGAGDGLSGIKLATRQ